MARALALAEQGRGSTRPNPVVGCVLVDRQGEVVGEGWHERPGGPHAEIVALQAAGARARGATVYVTLEPCDHHGRTGPCSVALLEAGVDRVVYAVPDPGARSGGGGARLAANGVDVVAGVLADEAAAANEGFLHTVRTGRPLVTLKLAQTLDGELAVADGGWVTGPQAREEVHRLRARSDAVLVGIGTVLADDPRLDARAVATPQGQPRAVVVDTQGRTPAAAAVVRAGTIVLTVSAGTAWRQQLWQRGVEVVEVAADRGRVDVRAALHALADRDIQTVLAEPGSTLAASLVAGRAVDRLVLHVAPRRIAASGLPRTPACLHPAGAPPWQVQRTTSRGDDVELVAVPAVPAERA